MLPSTEFSALCCEISAAVTALGGGGLVAGSREGRAVAAQRSRVPAGGCAATPGVAPLE